MALWNQRNLDPPVVLNAPCKSKHIKSQISALTKTSTSMLNYYSTLNTFEKAAAFETRFVNRFKFRLRNMHGFQVMRRVNQTLIRIKNLDLVQVIMDLHSFLPESEYIPQTVNLPVRSNLEYLLVRMQGLCKLLMRVVYLTKEAARFHVKQIVNMHLYPTYVMFLGLMGELWLFSRSVCRRTVQFYDELYPALEILPETKVSWLPEHYQLPVSLAAWLGEEYERDILQCGDANGATSSNWLGSEGDADLFTLLQHSTTDGEEQLLSRKQETEAANKGVEEALTAPSFSSVPKAMLLQSLRSDTGEVVERKGRNAPATQFDAKQLDHIRSKFHVQQFLKQERTNRTDSPAKALTKGLSEQQFGDFNVRLMKEFNRLSSVEFVKFFKEQFLQLVTEGT
uniref:Nucleolus and neural progenitor protein-like N-terminal domain-containing protein n=2 Tax=Anopheles coluzzii TaxID=1518534 RepID=A0A8W7PQA6_ANOCL